MKLGGILIPFKTEEAAGWKAVCDSILLDARDVAKEGRLCKFYLIWKLHKIGKCNWNRDPIQSGCYKLHNRPCIALSTLSVAGGGFEAQQCHERLAGSDQRIRYSKLQRVSELRITTADIVAFNPARTRNGSLAMIYG